MVKFRRPAVNGHLAAMALDQSELDAETTLQFFVRSDINGYLPYGHLRWSPAESARCETGISLPLLQSRWECLSPMKRDWHPDELARYWTLSAEVLNLAKALSFTFSANLRPC